MEKKSACASHQKTDARQCLCRVVLLLSSRTSEILLIHRNARFLPQKVDQDPDALIRGHVHHLCQEGGKRPCLNFHNVTRCVAILRPKHARFITLVLELSDERLWDWTIGSIKADTARHPMRGIECAPGWRMRLQAYKKISGNKGRNSVRNCCACDAFAPPVAEYVTPLTRQLRAAILCALGFVWIKYQVEFMVYFLCI